ncbi:MAG TPA: GntR family transcriptional regulator [Euzebyales bacterium]|nr:GntR family transcriptional regulator [Euzebyales bacterium]
MSTSTTKHAPAPTGPAWPGTVASLDAVLRPVREGNAFEEAVQRILQAIKLGAVTAGERLPAERDLAKRLGISRVTLREALRALIDAGFVESRRGRSGGTFVTYQPDEHTSESPRTAGDVGAQLEDKLALRRALEPGVAELAAEQPLDDAARASLSARLAEVPADGSREAHRLADARLHLAIAEVTGSASLIAAVADVQMSLGDLLAAIPVLKINIEHSHGQHAAVIAAILDGDAPQARDDMRAHVDATASLLRGFLG